MTQADAPNATVVWFADKGFVEDLIHRKTGSRFDHVGMVLAGSYYECAGGVGVHRITDASRVAAIVQEAAAFRAYVLNDEDLQAAVGLAERMLGERYSTLELLADAFGLDLSLPNTGVCSYAVALWCAAAHIYESTDPRHESPGSLAVAQGVK